jgi:hypothetical protein
VQDSTGNVFTVGLDRNFSSKDRDGTEATIVFCELFWQCPTGFDAEDGILPVTESRASQIDGAFESFYCRLRVDERVDLTELMLNHAVDFRFGTIHSFSSLVRMASQSRPGRSVACT